MSAHIAADGSLTISGHVLGPKASRIGDELEYWIKFEPQHLDRLADALATLLGTDPTSAAIVPSMLKLALERSDFERGGRMEWLTVTAYRPHFPVGPDPRRGPTASSRLLIAQGAKSRPHTCRILERKPDSVHRESSTEPRDTAPWPSTSASSPTPTKPSKA